MWNMFKINNKDTRTTASHKMVKHTQTIRLLLPTNYLSLFDHFMEYSPFSVFIVNFEHLNSRVYFH